MTSHESEEGAAGADDSIRDAGEAAGLERVLRDLPAEIELPPGLLDRFKNSIRVALLPGYRQETLLGERTGVFYTYLLSASGTGITNAEGVGSINLATLLACVTESSPMHPGLHPSGPVSGEDIVPGDPIMIGTPITVVTGTGNQPTIFQVANQGVGSPPSVLTNQYAFSWQSPVPDQRVAATVVDVRSYGLDGSPRARAPFGWHLTLELLFLVFSN